MSNCISCGKKIDPAKTETEAYIIPAALGGRLTAKKQYCNSCLQLFKENVDRPFVKLFAPVTSLLLLAKDRELKQTEIKTDKAPKFPASLYASTENKKLLAQGLTKIAISYALSRGVDSKFISHLFERNTLIANDNIIPYFPVGATERAFDLLRPESEASYPTHSLKLFTSPHKNAQNQQPVLACFIDLFSSFQFFVILNNTYSGPTIKDTLSYQPIEQTEDIPIRVRSQEDILELQQSGFDCDALREQYQQLSAPEQSKIDFFSFVEEQLRNFSNEQWLVESLERVYSRAKVNEYLPKHQDRPWQWLEQKLQSPSTLVKYGGSELIDLPSIQFELTNLLHESNAAALYFFEHEEIRPSADNRISPEHSLRVNFFNKVNHLCYYLHVLKDIYTEDSQMIDLYWQCKYLALQDFCQARSLVTKIRGLPLLNQLHNE